MAQTSPTEEPKTPMWLPAVGAVLFLVVGIWWATRPGDPPPAPTEDTTETTAAGDAGPG